MLISDYDYELPERLIAQEPLGDRSASRMLVARRQTQTLEDRKFTEFPELIRPGDLIVLNNTRVFPARLLGLSETGARVELFLVREVGENVWETLARPAKRLKPGKTVFFSDELAGEIIERLDIGTTTVKFSFSGIFDEILQRVGRTPLPPYIKRGPKAVDADRERYQTVYARHSGAIAAPTAGLHFTPDILERVINAGGQVCEITLHVGYGTFEPVRVDDLAAHSVQPEKYEIGESAADALNAAKRDGRRTIAIGTTTTRALEHSFAQNHTFLAEKTAADLTIRPGFRFAAVDALLTNFHLPRSSLLVLTSTFGGHEFIMEAYRHAVASDYRFYSYGDCMFIW